MHEIQQVCLHSLKQQTNSAPPPNDISLRPFSGKRYLRRSHLLLDDERFPRDTKINILDIVGSSFEMTCCIITLGDVTMVFRPVFNGNIEIRHRHKSELVSSQGKSGTCLELVRGDPNQV